MHTSDYSLLDSVEIYKPFLKVLLYIIYSFAIAFILVGLSYLIAEQSPYLEKISAYECGFEPFEDAREKFKVSFYIVAILFLIFDVEIVYLFPWVMALSFLSTAAIWGMIFFLILLAVGFVYEILEGALAWV